MTCQHGISIYEYCDQCYPDEKLKQSEKGMKMYIVLAKRKFSKKDKEYFSEHKILEKRISVAFLDPEMMWKIPGIDYTQSITIVETKDVSLAEAQKIAKNLKVSKYPKYSDIKIYNMVEVN